MARFQSKLNILRACKYSQERQYVHAKQERQYVRACVLFHFRRVPAKPYRSEKVATYPYTPSTITLSYKQQVAHDMHMLIHVTWPCPHQILWLILISASCTQPACSRCPARKRSKCCRVPARTRTCITPNSHVTVESFARTPSFR